jgi:AcrR family transcriptional regulator
MTKRAVSLRRHSSGKGRRRLPPDVRKATILRATVDVLERHGLDGFSVEAVAREAGVAKSLPRHYFGSYEGLLTAAVELVLQQIEETLLAFDLSRPMKMRVSAYLTVLSKGPWGHKVWMRSAEFGPDIEGIVRESRRRISEAMYRKTWQKLTKRERIEARGRIGYIEAVVAEFLDDAAEEYETFVDLITQAVTPRQLSIDAQRILDLA